ncbi:conserved hypothetical protein [delta proteobacterium NaphS2]|nr:conserved hypothetical protein [delta proteobacterium NaphS2]
MKECSIYPAKTTCCNAFQMAEKRQKCKSYKINRQNCKFAGSTNASEPIKTR